MTSANIISVYLYGSTIYGTANRKSDFDLIVVVDHKDDVTITSRAFAKAREYFNLSFSTFDVNIYTEEEFLKGLECLEIAFLECVNNRRANSNHGTLIFGKLHKMPKIHLPTLRDSISRKASNSWVKAKKKLTVQEDLAPLIGKKSAWHAIRIIDFGIQLAIYGKINNVASQSLAFFDVMDCQTWEEIDRKFRGVYNSLSTEFRKVAPKEIKETKDFKNFEEWFFPFEQGVNECWYGDAEEAVKKFGRQYEQYVRDYLKQKEAK